MIVRCTRFLLIWFPLLAIQAADSTLLKESPFLPTGTAAAVGNSASDPYQFTGVSTFGHETLVSIFDARKQRSHWINVGESFDGLTVQSYDAAHDSATVQVEGKSYVLHLREKSPASSSTVFTAATTPAPPQASPLIGNPVLAKAKEDQEAQEARMLVQDLLEIGMQQRAAYEAARQKAANEAKTK